jgi:sec-independent protein translocase protein TatA
LSDFEREGIRLPLRSVTRGEATPDRRFNVFSGFGPTELIIVLVIVLLIFGPKRLPGLGRQIGTGMREFKESITGKDDDDEPDSADSDRKQVTAALGRPEGEPPATVDTTAASADTARERTPQA